jgi:hypothetical protein
MFLPAAQKLFVTMPFQHRNERAALRRDRD